MLNSLKFRHILTKLRPDKLVRSIVTRLVWQWDNKRSYPIRDEVFEFPPVITSQDILSVRLVVLTTPSRINNAAWTARSIIANVKCNLALTFVIDGEVSSVASARLGTVFPAAEIVTAQKMLESIIPKCPSLAKLAEYHPMGKKVAILLETQRHGPVLYSDDDVLAFKPLQEIDALIDAGSLRAGYLHTPDHGTSVEPSIMEAARSLNLSWLDAINVGFMLLPQNSLDSGLCEKILKNAQRVETWFPDTMLIATLLKQVESQPLPTTTYVTNVQRQFWGEKDVDYSNICLRHFVTPVRHLMYARGMPLVKEARLKS